MAKKQIYPAVNAYIAELCGIADGKKAYGADTSSDQEIIAQLAENNAKMFGVVKELEKALAAAEETSDVEAQAKKFAYEVLPLMNKTREYADAMEVMTAKDYWPMPTYSDILFSVE